MIDGHIELTDEELEELKEADEPEEKVPVIAVRNRAGTAVIRYTATIRHEGLGAIKELSARDVDALAHKILAQRAKWREEWRAIQLDIKKAKLRRASLEEAERATTEAAARLGEIDNLLASSLHTKPSLDWELLKDRSEFPTPSPARDLDSQLREVEEPPPPRYRDIPPEPDPNAEWHQPKLNILDRLISSRKEKKTEESRRSFQEARKSWEQDRRRVEDSNARLKAEFELALAAYEKRKDEVREANAKMVEDWEEQKGVFLEKQAKRNAKTDTLKEKYDKHEPSAVVWYCEKVLENSEYPDSFPQDFEVDYNPSNRILIVEYDLPPIESFPTRTEVRFIPSRNEMKDFILSPLELAKTFDSAMYKITLRSLHELFTADVADAIDAIAFNGWISAINRATGKMERNCILSVQVKKQDFLQVDLANVDPKACFRNFRGVGSSKLSGLTPIAPLLQISREDKRFIMAREVADKLNEGFNLAAMDWEDFEHLIREIFEKEFSVNGGEVKVTQASRDGGVDAVAFDPDPIRGGKIVIQAKRYTNTVGVSAVRDLYGTVMNEGATKGILVTTADYGPDAYDFARGKPLTLLSGSNLLHLLEKHGHKARIDLAEARKLMSEQQREHEA